LFGASSVLHGKADAQLDAKIPVITGSGTFRFPIVARLLGPFGPDRKPP
jgi:hypothetical protein